MAAEIASLGAVALPYCVDVCDEVQVEGMAEAAPRNSARWTSWPNAGSSAAACHTFRLDDWKKTIEVMDYGTYQCCKALVPGTGSATMAG